MYPLGNTSGWFWTVFERGRLLYRESFLISNGFSNEGESHDDDLEYSRLSVRWIFS
jgi:hypothetical protein